MYIIETHIVPQEVQAIRLSDYCVDIFKAIPSRKGIKKAIKRGEIWVDGQVQNSAWWVVGGQRISLVNLEEKLPKVYALPLEVVYEDPYMAIVNKPPGMVVSGNQYATIEHALPFNLTPSEGADALKWPRPVHRLDKATSGLLIIAKTRTAHMNLGQLFENKHIHKKYGALVIGKTEAEGNIISPIEQKASSTSFRLLRQVPSLKNEFLSLLEATPHTGRTHQIRIHLSSIGFPILGDSLYGREGMILKSKGLFLSAFALEFPHPISSEPLQFQVDLPAKFRTFPDRELRRWQQHKG